VKKTSSSACEQQYKDKDKDKDKEVGRKIWSVALAVVKAFADAA